MTSHALKSPFYNIPLCAELAYTGIAEIKSIILSNGVTEALLKVYLVTCVVAM